MAFKLPRLLANLPIVNELRQPTNAFLRLFNDAFTTIEEQEASQEQVIANLVEIVAALQAATAVAQAAQQTANEALAEADAAGGGTVTSGSAMAQVTPEASGWYPGPQVDLTGVVAGNLTIPGTGPQQSDTTTSIVAITGEFRVVEIVSMVETTVFTGFFTMTSGSPPTVVNQSAAAVASFSLARASTGAVSYRLDAQRTDGGAAISPIELDLYLFARRS